MISTTTSASTIATISVEFTHLASTHTMVVSYTLCVMLVVAAMLISLWSGPSVQMKMARVIM